MKSLGSLVLCALAGALLCSSALVAQQAAAPVVHIVAPVDESNLVTLHGTVHRLANAANDRGAAPDDMQLERLHLVLKRSADQETALRQFIADTHASSSPGYHKWLSPDEFGKQFGPSDQDIATVENWLQGHGFSIARVNPGKQTIEISGTVAQLRSAFHTQIHKYEVNGETHYANAGDPSIPDALAPVVGGFVSLNNFRLKSYAQKLGEASYSPSTGRAKPSWTIGGGTFDYQNYNFVLSPADYAVQYDLQKLYNNGTKGDGETIAIINESNINVYLVNQFRSLFGLPANPPQVIIDGNDPGIDGINNPYGPNYASVEAYLDVEWAGAVAPNATVDLVIAGDTALSQGLVLAMEHAVYGNVAPILSLSFGGCEYDQGSFNQYISSLWEQAAAQGQTVLVSTGDNGSAGCDDAADDYATQGQAVNGLASTPYNVAVGGTDFYYSSYNQGDTAINTQLESFWSTTASNTTPALTIKGYIPEQPWNDSQFGLNLFSYYADSGEQDTTIAAGSGGASNCVTLNTSGNCAGGYAKPSWQSPTTIPSIPNDNVRDLPDVSLFAANGPNDSYYPICATDGDCTQVNNGFTQIFGVGGTSASTPAFAGMMALVDQSMAGSGNPDGRQGQADYILYPLYSQFQSGATPPYHDVINGTNSVPCNIDTTESGQAESPDCIAINSSLDYAGIDDPTYGVADEGQIGIPNTPWYNAASGYDLATGLGTIDAYNLVTNWSKVTLTASSTTMNSVSSPISLGTSVTIGGTVTGSSPTGTVALMTDSTEPLQAGQGVFKLTNGSYSGSYSNLPGGTYHIWTYYSGDSNNGPSSSTPVEVTVGTGTSAVDFNIFSPVGPGYASSLGTNFTSAGSSISGGVDYGTQFNLSAVIAPSSQASAEQSCIISGSCSGISFPTPTGAVTFADNGSTIDTAALNAQGEAAYYRAFGVGSHSVTASYSGDSSYSSSTASAITFSIIQDTPTLSVTASNYLSSQGAYGTQANQPTVLNVQIENGSGYAAATAQPPTGAVTVSGLPSGVPTSATLTAAVDPTTGAPEGIATFTIPANTTGNYTATFSYQGDSNYKSASEQFSVPVEGFTGGTASTTAATMSGSISPGSTIMVTGTVTGSGSASPAAVGSDGYVPGVLVFSSGYYITEIGFSSSTGNVSHFSFALNSQTLFQGGNFITLQYTGSDTYYPSAVTLNSGSVISNPLSDFTAVPATATLAVPTTSDAADTISLASVNGFSGAVSLTCTAASGVTCSVNPASATLSSGGAGQVTLEVVGTAATAGTGYKVLVTAKDSTGEYIHTLSVNAVATSSALTPTFALGSAGAISVSPGSTTENTSAITLTPSNGFSSTVSLNCSVASPSGATDAATCALSSSSVALSGTASQNATLTITTTAATSLNAPLKLFWPATGGTVLAALLFFLVPRRRRNWPLMVALLAIFVAGAVVGCGGGGGSGSGGGGGGGGGSSSPGTTAGTYAVTVTGTSNSTTQTTIVTVNVE
jgi:hypothetical protein